MFTRVAIWHFEMPNKSNLAILQVVWLWEVGNIGSVWQFGTFLAVFPYFGS